MIHPARSVLLALALPLAALLAAPAPAGAEAAADRPRRVLVVFAPTLTATDLGNPGLANLRAFAGDAALAATSTRAVELSTTAGDSYATIGAGARAQADAAIAGTNVNAAEPVDGATGAVAFAARTEQVLPPDGVGVLAIQAIDAQNEDLPYDSAVGAFATALTANGFVPSVVANADSRRGRPEHREAVLALADGRGITRGLVSDVLLRDDPSAPDGLVLDERAVAAAFDARWADRAVVGVELSDLARAARARSGREGALARSDALFGALLSRVDLARDLVMVVGTYPPPGDPQLTVTAVRGPAVTRGWLVSATTRRAGYVSITDVAPTVLDRLGVTRPSSMEGRPMRVEAGTEPLATRVSVLKSANAQAQFRDRTIGPATNTLWILTVLVAIAAAIWLPQAGPGRRRVAVAALTVPGALLGTYVAMLFPVERWGAVSYWVLVAVVSLGFAAVVELLSRGDPWARTMIAFGALGGFHVLNQLIGGPLEINAVFGYNATVGVRVQGLGNQSFSQLAPCALVVAAMCLSRPGGRAGRSLMFGTFALTVAVTGAPWWGADFGGFLAEVIAFSVFAWMVFGRALRARVVIAAGAAAAVLGVALGFLDFARPASQRTHVGRLFERVQADGFDGLATIIGRKAELMIGTFANLVYVSTFVVVIIVVALLWRRAPSYGRELEATYPAMRPLLVGFAAMAFFGMVLNDSGASIPGMMSMVVIAALATMAPGRAHRPIAPPSGSAADSEEGSDVLLPQ